MGVRTATAFGATALLAALADQIYEATLARVLSERAAHAASGATAVVAFAGYSALQRRWPIPTSGEALRIGGVWLALTVAVEFGFGRTESRTWPLVLAWIALGPAVVRELQAR